MFNIKSTLHTIKMFTIKNSPDILLGVGIISGVGATVIACKKTLRAESIIDNHKEMLDKINQAIEISSSDEYTDKDIQIDRLKTYVKTTGEIIKLYAPVIMLETLSITSFVLSHNILKNRYLGTIAALSATTTAFANYRKNVISEYGKEVDQKMRMTVKDIIETKTNTEGITENIVKKEIIHDGYSKIFDETNANFVKDSEQNRFFLITTQRYLNDILISRSANGNTGHLFLNEVYAELGFPPTKMGQVVGWLYDPNNPEDCYVDFGIFNINDDSKREFINGYEKAIWLDFNVQGNILDIVPLEDK